MGIADVVLYVECQLYWAGREFFALLERGAFN